MANTRVIFISQITAGSKFRTIQNRMSQVATNKTRGIQWASCKVTDNGGNFQRPFDDSGMPPKLYGYRWFQGTWIKVYPPDFNIFNRPCPWSIGHLFTQGGKS